MENSSDEIFTVAQGGVMLDTVEQMQQWAPRIRARAVDTTDMPFMNKTAMTDDERQLLARWIAAGAPSD